MMFRRQRTSHLEHVGGWLDVVGVTIAVLGERLEGASEQSHWKPVPPERSSLWVIPGENDR